MCDHDWHPVSGWFARYWCSHCRALGFKYRVVMGYGDALIHPYRCNARSGGGRCSNLAVTRQKRQMRCPEHCSGQRTFQARKQSASARGVATAAIPTGDATPRRAEPTNPTATVSKDRPVARQT